MLKIGSIKGKKIELVYVGSNKGRPKGWVGSGSGNAKGHLGPTLSIFVFTKILLSENIRYDFTHIFILEKNTEHT